ncbi:recombinase family protein [Carnobacterium maltaromaticum]|uniref:recombinase family protein n=1 Tax=Carnobacterium maltaromaticum TaxID=2751 RepID=UPI00191BC9C0|nr:recombinase family protein [Carnobacterium maltaromaticum]CAD5902533.1 conserved hypothetical protein [Carnobacterium maltaromaticum]
MESKKVRNKRGKEYTKQQRQIRKAFKSPPTVEVIPAKNNVTSEFKGKIRVAAYCRVSTYAEAQSGSFELQKQSYLEKINRNQDWELVDIYADQGVSGTSIKGRKNFTRMLNDCKLDKIDLIIVKSMSRFSRNQLDFISIYRELKALSNPVGILIENLNINTLDTNSELILGIVSIIAQGESEQKSEAITWSIIERFKKGIPIIPTHNLLGYSKDKFGSIIIVDDEASIVKYIFNSFINGSRAMDIAADLMKNKILTVLGNEFWSTSAIYRILRNEKYAGNVLMQKTYTVDCFSHKKRKNNGEKPKYFLRNALPSIVTEDKWLIVQELLKNPRKGNLLKKKKVLQKPKSYVSTVKSGIFQGFLIMDVNWSQSEIKNIINEGEC